MRFTAYYEGTNSGRRWHHSFESVLRPTTQNLARSNCPDGMVLVRIDWESHGSHEIWNRNGWQGVHKVVFAGGG